MAVLRLGRFVPANLLDWGKVFEPVNRVINDASGGITLGVTDGVTAPAADTELAVIYVDASDGGLKVKFTNGTVKVLATNP